MKKIELPENLIATFQREVVSKPANKARFFVTLGLVLTAFMILFAIRPVSLTYAENRKLLQELLAIEGALTAKVTQLDQADSDLRLVPTQVELLYRRLPQDEAVGAYLEDFVNTATNTGFAVQGFRRQEAFEGAVPLEMDLTGDLVRIPELIAAIENDVRLVQLQDVRTEFLEEEGLTRVRILVNVFYFEGIEDARP